MRNLLYAMTIHANAYCTVSECGEREAHTRWPIMTPEKAAPVTRTTFRATVPVPEDSRQ